MVGSRGLKGIALGAVLRKCDATDAVAKANNACCTERVSATLSGHYSQNDNNADCQALPVYLAMIASCTGLGQGWYSLKSIVKVARP